MLQEFKAFVMRGSLLEIAVAFIMGVAFATVVTSFTEVVLGFVAFVFGGDVSFDQLAVHRGTEAVIPYGAFITAVITFLIVAFILFLVVRAYNRMSRKAEETPTTRPCPHCMTDIPREATRCSACTSEVAPATA